MSCRGRAEYLGGIGLGLDWDWIGIGLGLDWDWMDLRVGGGIEHLTVTAMPYGANNNILIASTLRVHLINATLKEIEENIRSTNIWILLHILLMVKPA